MAPFITNGKSLLYMQRSVAHFPLAPQCVVVGRSRSGKGSVLFTFNPSTGKSIDPETPNAVTLPFNIMQAMLLPYQGKRQRPTCPAHVCILLELEWFVFKLHLKNI